MYVTFDFICIGLVELCITQSKRELQIQIETSTKMYTPFLNRIKLTTWTICAFRVRKRNLALSGIWSRYLPLSRQTPYPLHHISNCHNFLLMLSYNVYIDKIQRGGDRLECMLSCITFVCAMKNNLQWSKAKQIRILYCCFTLQYMIKQSISFDRTKLYLY